MVRFQGVIWRGGGGGRGECRKRLRLKNKRTLEIGSGGGGDYVTSLSWCRSLQAERSGGAHRRSRMRSGLVNMVIGVATAVGARYDVDKITIEHLDRIERLDHETHHTCYL